MAADFIDWPGSAGAKYRYWFVQDTSPAGIKDQPGNYMFVRLTNPQKGWWRPVYIGIADSLRQRLTNHEVWEEAKRCGATRIMGHTQTDSVVRASEERDLIGYWNPQCNVQHRTNRQTG